MERLIAVHKHTTRSGGKAFGYQWIKKPGEALEKCRKALLGLDDKAVITDVWVSAWRDVPSKYSLQYGNDTPENQAPNIDFAADLRKRHVRKPGETKRAFKQRTQPAKPRIVLTNEKATPPAAQPVVVDAGPFRYFIPEEA